MARRYQTIHTAYVTVRVGHRLHRERLVEGGAHRLVEPVIAVIAACSTKVDELEAELAT